jgi:PIN domain
VEDARSLILILDTNAIVGDWLLASPAARHVRNQSTYGSLALVVPDLVVREAARVYRREFKAAQRELHTALLRRQRLDAGAPDQLLAQIDTSLDADAAAARHEAELRRVLERANARVLPLPDVSHARLINDSLRGEKPFDQEGRKGYRDALIWHSVLGVARCGTPLVLVTANHKDFARSADAQERLADDLAEDLAALRQAGAPQAEVRVRVSLASSIAQDFPAEDAVVLELRERLSKDRAFFATVYGQLNDYKNRVDPDVELNPELGFDWDDLELDFVHDLHAFDIVSGAGGSSGAPWFVRIVGHTDVQYHVEVSAREMMYRPSADALQDVHWNERTDTGTFTDVLPAELDFQALYTSGADTLGDVELVALHEDWSWSADGRLLGGPVDRPDLLR